MAKKKVVKKVVKRKVLKKVPRKKPVRSKTGNSRKKPAKKNTKKKAKKPAIKKANSYKKNENSEVIHIDDMYSDWFIDYASYVILERAVPSIHDGLKPVQRRILHSLKEKDDGRYNKVV